jgi:acyl carrier protein
VRDQVLAVLATLADLPPDDTAPLALDSLTTVQLVEALEAHFGFTAQAREMNEANLGTLAGLVAWVERRAEGRA